MTANNKYGIGVIVLFSSFALLIISMVLFASFTGHELVEEDYYQKEIQYQTQIEKINNSLKLNAKPKIEFNQDTKLMTLRFPKIDNQILSGVLTFYRPSDASLDYNEAIKTDTSGVQHFDLSKLDKGFWKLKIDWSDNNKSFYSEEKIFIK